MEIKHLHTITDERPTPLRLRKPRFKEWQSLLLLVFALTFTLAAIGQTVPTITRNPVSNLTSTSVTLGGNITSNGGATIISSGVVYSTLPGPALFGIGVTDSTTTPVVTTGSFSVNPAGLTPFTKYYYKAYATNSVGTAYTIEDSFTTSVQVSSLPYFQNFDGPGVTGWTSGSIAGTNDWVVGTPAKTQINAAYSAPNSWVTKLTGAYSGNTNIYLQSPEFDFTAQVTDPVFSFRHNFLTDIGWHGGVLEMQINNGAWTKVDNTTGTGATYNTTNSTGWYNSASANGPMTPSKWSGNSNVYAGQTNGWILSQTTLTGAAGQAHVRLRFRFACDGFGMTEGWAIDNIRVFLPSEPVVVTGTYSNLQMSTVTTSGNITSNGGRTVTTSGIVMSTSSSPVLGGFGVIDSPTNPLVTNGQFSKGFSGLMGGTTYYYRAYATNSIGTGYGADSTFTTPAAAILPTLTTVAATNIKTTTATFGGNISLDGGSPIFASGVVFGTSPNPAQFGFGVIDSPTNPLVTSGAFSFNTSGLMPSTKYYFRAYASNMVGTAYGNQDSFTTAPLVNWLPYAQNFDTAGVTTGWVSGAITGANDWVVGTPAKGQIASAYSTPNCWITKTTGSYSGAQDIYVESPQFDFTGQNLNPVLSFRHNFLTDIGWHGAIVEISINNGAWTKLDNTTGTGTNFNTPNSSRWYNSSSANGPVAPSKFSATSTAYASQSGGWIHSVTPLPGTAGQSNVRVRFRFGCDGAGMTEGWAIDNIEVFLPSSPSVITGTRSNITTSAAVVNGTITANGYSPVTASGVVIGTSPAPVRGGFGVIDSSTSPLVTGGSYSIHMQGLSAATTYYYRAYAENAAGLTYGADSTFNTLAVATAPVLTTNRPTLVQGTSARIGGNIANDGGAAIFSSGVVFSTTPNPTIGNFGVTDSTTNPVVTSGSYSFNLAGLTPVTRYYYRAYAINAVGTSYGTEDSLTTPPVVTVLPYSENFDAAGVNTGWDAASVAGGVNNWVLGNPAKAALNGSYSGSNSWVTKLTANYDNGVNAAVVSPRFDFTAQTADPILRFRHKFSTIAGVDGGVVEISLDGGSTWSQLDNTVGTGTNFNTATSIAWNNYGASFWTPIGANFSGLSSGYSSQVAGWIQSTVRLTGAAGQANVRIRMRFGSTTQTFFGTQQGWQFDNVEVFPPTAPDVVTGTHTNITNVSGTISGTITSNGNSTITASGMVYSTSPAPVRGGFGVVDSANNPVITTGSFSKNISGLMPSTMYYYRAYAVNAIGTSYGADSTFITPASASAPTIQLVTVTNLTATSATAGGNIITDGGAPVYASGVVYSTSPNPVIFGPGVIDSATNPVVTAGTFTVNPAGLTHSTKYYYRAYAANSAGTTYTNQDSFNTSPIISVLPYSQNFDVPGNTGWRSGSVTGTNDWVIGTPAKAQLSGAYSAPNCWVTRTTGNFSGNTNIYVESPQFDLTSATVDPVIQFRHNFVMDNGWHGAVAEISINGGAYVKLDNTQGVAPNYNTAASIAWYNSTSTLGPMAANKWSGNSSAFTPSSGGWIQSRTALTGAAGQSDVKVRFRFACDGGGLNEGWAIDNIEVLTPSVPTVITGTKSAVVATSAVLSGNITSGGGLQIQASGIVLSTAPAPVRGGMGVVDSATAPVITSGTFTRSFASLIPGTTYYYRAYAVNSLGTSYGDDSTFVTPVSAVQPSVNTTAASLVASTTATAGGSIVSDGGATITASGVIHSASSANLFLGNAGVTDHATSPVVTSGNYTLNMTTLTHSTKYYFRAYSMNSAGIGYGDIDSFTTSPIVSSFPYTQNFDAPGNTGWVSGSITGVNDWVVGTPAKLQIASAFSTPNCWITKTTGNYTGGQDIYVESPQFDFTTMNTDPVIRFRHNFLTDLNWHGGIMEISINGGPYTKADAVLGTGTNYNTPASLGWYNNNSANGPVPPKWSGSSTGYVSHTNGWIQSGTVLPGAAGQSNVKVRFRFVTDAIGMTEGWAIDNIEVTEIVAPLTPAANVTISPVGNTTATVSWTNGNGQGRLVVARLSTTAPVAPANMVNYAAAAAYHTADSTGTGNYIVYKGTGSSVNVTGLTVLTGYTFDVYEYNGSFMHVRFNTSAATSSTTTTPVRLVSFAASNSNGDGYLTWSTSSEKNNAGFEIERSTDNKTFERVNFVKGAGTSNTLKRYAYTDGSVFKATGSAKVYYRLKQVDRDGRFEYSNVVSVAAGEAGAFAVTAFPVPFVKDVNVRIVSASGQQATLTVTDIQGRTIAAETAEIPAGENTVTVSSLNGLKAGVYFIKVTLGAETSTVRVVKSN